ncbi:putative viral a-type inclusion protein repeat protein [Erysiphe necator]|uniref:Putative viral a-type inclusion protein repeat protein n=1 Tax=Uncinula necator TaxID=52586 RepID=A0A0B1P3Q2_UNCNE|nr:putative viral a-type inclusion protein repeat protein [Erysiphe necator]
MFQRLKGAIDSRIAEEQARQKALANAPISRSLSSSSRTESRKDHSPKQKSEKRQENGIDIQGPDPHEFEKAFVIDDEDERPVKEAIPERVLDESPIINEINITPTVEDREASSTTVSISPTPQRLPQEVRVKLRKLERLETKYQELLRSYRVAHARAISIEVFEKQLREYTPLSTISDPDALVEYLNQLKLKGDIVMDEFKRVSSDRDEYKKKYEESHSQLSTCRENLISLKNSSPQSECGESLMKSTIVTTSSSPTLTSESHTPFANKVEEEIRCSDTNEELFSYEDELPLLKEEIKAKNSEIVDLKSKVSRLENEILSLEINSKINGNLKKIDGDSVEANVFTMKDQNDTKKIEAQEEEIKKLKKGLQDSNSQISKLNAELETKTKEYEKHVSLVEEELTNQKNNLDIALQESLATSHKSEAHCEYLVKKVEILEQARDSNLKLLQDLTNEFENLVNSRQIQYTDVEESPQLISDTKESNSAASHLGPIKKKGKKKKKGNLPPLSLNSSNQKTLELLPKTPSLIDIKANIRKIESEIRNQSNELAELKENSVLEFDYREEINKKQGFLSIICQEQSEKLIEENQRLKEKILKLEEDLKTLSLDFEDVRKLQANLKDLTTKFDELKLSSAALEIDLGAAQQLAISRYKDLTDLRELLQKIQPELTRLRTENADLKNVKDEKVTLSLELKGSETREKDLKIEIVSLKKQIVDFQSEIRTLNEKLKHENSSRLRAEDQQNIAQRDLRKSEAEKIQYAAASEKLASNLSNAQEETAKLNIQVRDLSERVSVLNVENKRLEEEVELRGSQNENSQALLTSMRDQVGEMAMQLKEAEAQSESLSEELSEVQRLLSERMREGETMRRLLADVDNSSDIKIRELQEKMEAAIKERDIAEDKVSIISRRKAKEFDEIKNRLSELELDLQRSSQDKLRLERAEIEWKQKFDDLKVSSENMAKEVEEIRVAMNQLRNALDGSEKAVKLAEKQKLDLRKILDESNHRHDKLHKEYKALHLKLTKLSEGSDRSSLESKNPKVSKSDDLVDYVYLKTIMLQFLEHKDRSVQESLVKTVLKQLLKFDSKEQERWIAAISTN